MMTVAEEVIIIGAGPAGIAAAIQCRREGLAPRVIEKGEFGGLLRNANLVENYPGFPEGIPGIQLARRFRDHLDRWAVRVMRAEVTRLAAEDGVCRIETDEEVYVARAVIVASGTKPVEFKDVEIPECARGRIFYEVYPIHDVAGKVIVVVGAGDVAVDYALTLARENRVVLLNRGTTVPCLSLLMNRARASPCIRYYPESRITGISCDGARELSIEAAGPEGRMQIEADYLLLAIGREPQLDFLAEPDARVLVEQGKIHVAGDAKNGSLRQTAIAVGDGVGAAMKIARMLRGGAA